MDRDERIRRARTARRSAPGSGSTAFPGATSSSATASPSAPRTTIAAGLPRRGLHAPAAAPMSRQPRPGCARPACGSAARLRGPATSRSTTGTAARPTTSGSSRARRRRLVHRDRGEHRARRRLERRRGDAARAHARRRRRVRPGRTHSPHEARTGSLRCRPYRECDGKERCGAQRSTCHALVELSARFRGSQELETVGRRRACGGAQLRLAGGGSASSGATKASAFEGYAFDACNAPKLDDAERLARVALPGARHLRRRRQPRLLEPPALADLDGRRRRDRMEPDPALRRPAGALRRPLGRRKDLPHARREPGNGRGRRRRRTTRPRSGSRRAARSTSTWRATRSTTRRAARPCRRSSSGWVNELHALGDLAGVYGSAGSTIRDLQALAATGSSPDDVWIADWNGNESVFGNPYVSDTLWTNHQRIHQYRGAHHETWNGATINIDSSYVDAAVVGSTGATPIPGPPATTPLLGESAAGSVTAVDGLSTVSWPAGAFRQSVVVTLTPALPTEPVAGFASGGYGVQLQVQQTATAQLRSGFGGPLTIHIPPRPGPLAPMTSTDGATWTAAASRSSRGRCRRARAPVTPRNADGSLDIETTSGGFFAMLPERTRPPAPAGLTGHFSHGELVLSWGKSTGPSGDAVSYQVTLTNHPLLAIPGQTTAAVARIHHAAPSVYRVIATDAAGKVERALQATRPHPIQAALEAPEGPAEMVVRPVQLAPEREGRYAPARTEDRSGLVLALVRLARRAVPHPRLTGRAGSPPADFRIMLASTRQERGSWPATTRKGRWKHGCHHEIAPRGPGNARGLDSFHHPVVLQLAGVHVRPVQRRAKPLARVRDHHDPRRHRVPDLGDRPRDELRGQARGSDARDDVGRARGRAARLHRDRVPRLEPVPRLADVRRARSSRS